MFRIVMMVVLVLASCEDTPPSVVDRGTDVVDAGAPDQQAECLCKLSQNQECIDGVCQCMEGFDDCDGDPVNGCETSLTSVGNCGLCGAPGRHCDQPGVAQVCTVSLPGQEGGCYLGCEPGHFDLDNTLTNGCEAFITPVAKSTPLTGTFVGWSMYRDVICVGHGNILTRVDPDTMDQARLEEPDHEINAPVQHLGSSCLYSSRGTGAFGIGWFDSAVWEVFSVGIVTSMAPLRMSDLSVAGQVIATTPRGLVWFAQYPLGVEVHSNLICDITPNGYFVTAFYPVIETQ